jgi:hypothetical protein
MYYQIDKYRNITLLEHQFRIDDTKRGTQEIVAYQSIRAINLQYFSNTKGNRGIGINLLKVGCHTCTIYYDIQAEVTMQDLPIDYGTGIKRNADYIRFLKLLHQKTANLPIDFYVGRRNFQQQFFVGLFSWVLVAVFLSSINIVVGMLATIFLLFTTWQSYRYEYPFTYSPVEIPARFLPLP